MRQTLTLLFLTSLAACAQDASPGNEALGITEFQTTETATRLEIVGLDAQNARVAKITLERGYVVIASDDLQGDGRTLAVEIHGRSATHQSVGTDPLTLPVVAPGSEIDAFLRDAHVAPALLRWGVGFEPSTAPTTATPAVSLPSGESAYAACGGSAYIVYDDSPYGLGGGCTYTPAGSCGSTSCTQYATTGGVVGQFICCGTQQQLINRLCSGTGHDSCGTEGPNGCAVCWSSFYDPDYPTCKTGNNATNAFGEICP